MHRITIQYGEPADPAAFDKHYQEAHVPLAAQIPGLRRYTLSRPRGLGGSAPYLVAEPGFDDADALKAALRAPEMATPPPHPQSLALAPMARFTAPVDAILAAK